jgi:hypothetical protein
LYSNPKSPRCFFSDVIEQLHARDLTTQLADLALELEGMLSFGPSRGPSDDALAKNTGVEVTPLTLTALRGEQRRVDAFTPHICAKLTRGAAVGFTKNPPFVFDRKPSALRAIVDLDVTLVGAGIR